MTEEAKENAVLNLNKYQYDKKGFKLFKENEIVGVYNNEFELTGKVLLELNQIAVVQLIEIPFYTTVTISINTKHKNKKGKYKIVTKLNAIKDLAEYIEKGKLSEYQKKDKKPVKDKKQPEVKDKYVTEKMKEELQEGVRYFFLHVPYSPTAEASDKTMLEQYYKNPQYTQTCSSPTPYNVNRFKESGATKTQISLLCGVTPNKLTALEKIYKTKNMNNIGEIDLFRFLWSFINYDKASITVSKIKREFLFNNEEQAEAFLKQKNIDLINWQYELRYTLKEIFEKVKEYFKKTVSKNPLDWSSFTLTYNFIREAIGVSEIDFLRFKEAYPDIRNFVQIELSKLKNNLIANDEKLRKEAKKHKVKRHIKPYKNEETEIVDYSNPFFLERVVELYKENPYLTKEQLRNKLELNQYNFIQLLKYNKEVKDIINKQMKTEAPTVKLTTIKEISKKYPKMSLAEKAKKLETTVEELNKTLDRYNLLQEKLQIDEQRIITEIMIYLFKNEKFIKRDIAEKCGLTASRFEIYCSIYGLDYNSLIEEAKKEVADRKKFK